MDHHVSLLSQKQRKHHHIKRKILHFGDVPEFALLGTMDSAIVEKHDPKNLRL